MLSIRWKQKVACRPQTAGCFDKLLLRTGPYDTWYKHNKSEQVIPKSSVESASLSHNYATMSPLVTMARPTLTFKSAPSFPFDDNHLPSNTPIAWPTPLTTPNGTWIQLAVLPQYTFQTHRPTDRYIHGLGDSSTPWALTLYCSRERRANNCYVM